MDMQDHAAGVTGPSMFSGCEIKYRNAPELKKTLK